MATIVLDPKESFEHFHSDESVTFHVEGRVEILMNDHQYSLKSGENITVPGNTRHTIINIGDTEAKVGCIGTAGNPHGKR